MFADLLDEGRYLWGGRWHLTKPGIDCLGLAMEVRSRILPNSAPLPEFPEVYERYTRATLPTNLVLDWIESHPCSVPVNIPSIGDLAVIEGMNNLKVLGTYVGSVNGIPNGVVLIGSSERPILIPDSNIPDLIGYWRPTLGIRET